MTFQGWITMDERGESSAPQQAWAPDEQQTAQFPQPQWGQGAQYAAPQQSYGQPAPTRAVKARPKWKTPLIAAVALVVGIAIGAAAGGGSKNSNSPNASGTTSTSSSPAAAPTSAAKSAAAAAPKSAAAPAAPQVPATAVVLTLSGSGQKTSKSFTIAKGDWSLKYSYSCSDGQGIFQVYEDYPSGGILANELETKGGQTTYQNADSGKHSLTVNSTCDWSLTATDGDGG